ncbi:hypothetical protein F4818DRAFT_437489 [Hypoxylon cercidicola]|nr:hypothetical protein F4818DRAFT_437489 [Hypoxylon cercidicola]
MSQGMACLHGKRHLLADSNGEDEDNGDDELLYNMARHNPLIWNCSMDNMSVMDMSLEFAEAGTDPSWSADVGMLKCQRYFYFLKEQKGAEANGPLKPVKLEVSKKTSQ